VCMAAALLHADGMLEFVEPFDCCDLDLADPYYLVVEHRNHLIVMTPDPVDIDPQTGVLNFDFRTTDSYIDDPFMFGFFTGQKEIDDGVYAMLAGNGNQTLTPNSDTDINLDDRTTWSADNGQIGEYTIGDYNLNGDTNFNDRVTWEYNNGTFTSVPR